MPDVKVSIKTIDGLVACAKNVERQRTPGESIQMCVDMLGVLKADGQSTIDDAVASLTALQPLITRITGGQ